MAEFANSVDLDEVAHNEQPHQDLHCLSSFFIFFLILTIFEKFAHENFVVVKELNYPSTEMYK